MADKIIEKRKFVWKIINFTREAVNKYEKATCVKSENFEILLGDFGDNMTEWSFCFYPKESEDNCAFYIHKLGVDRDDFLIKMDVAIQKNDGTAGKSFILEKKSNLFPLGQGWGWSKFLEFKDVFKPENKYLTNDTITLIIKLDLQQDGPPAKKPRLDLALPEWMAKNFNSEVLSDVTIVCSDKKSIPAHRSILASRSSVFKTMLTTDMAEKKSNKITVAGIKSDTMLELMRYIYKQEVQDLKKHASKLLDCAEKYDIPDLKQFCVQQLIEQLSDENVFENMLLANSYNERKLIHKCMDYINTHFWKLKETVKWKKFNNDLMVSIMSYMQERFNGITFINSL